MKKILLIVAVLFFAANLSKAQDFTVGVRVGMNVANIGGDYEGDAKLGLKAGIVGTFPLADNIYLEPGAFFSPKGSKLEYKTLDGKNAKHLCNLNYLEIPINGVYKYEINSNLTVRGHLGPYFGFGVCGKSKDKIDGKVDKNSKNKNFKQSGNNLKAFDCGLNVGAGIEFSVCYLGVQYGFGLVNMSKDDDYKMRNGVFSVDFGVNF